MKEYRSNTLVIHPADHTTDCLKVIYEGKGWDVINDINTTDREVCNAIRSHERIIMLGHGTPGGLLCSDGRSRFGRYIIHRKHMDLLKDKDTFSVWCNSDQFFIDIDGKGGKGFHTGMIISEVCEERYVLGNVYLNEQEMATNMEVFCGAVSAGVDLAPEECKRLVLDRYVGDDEVIKYNRNNVLVL